MSFIDDRSHIRSGHELATDDVSGHHPCGEGPTDARGSVVEACYACDRELRQSTPLLSAGMSRSALDPLWRAGYVTLGEVSDLYMDQLRAVPGLAAIAREEVRRLLETAALSDRPLCHEGRIGPSGTPPRTSRHVKGEPRPSWPAAPNAGERSAGPRAPDQAEVGPLGPPTDQGIARRLDPLSPLTLVGLSAPALDSLWQAGYTTLGEVAARHEDQLRRILPSGTLDEVVRCLGIAGLSPGYITRERLRVPRASDPPIEVLALPSRVLEALRLAGINWVWQAAQLRAGDLETVPGLTPAGLVELREGILTLGADTGYAAAGAPDTRAARMAALALDGLTLENVGDRFGLTRERIRQVLNREGVTTAQLAHAKVARRRRRTEPHSAAALTLFREGLELDEISSRVGLQVADVKALIREHGTPADRATRQQRRAAERETSAGAYSEGDLAAAIRRVAEHIGDVPSSSRYQEVARELGLPSVPTIINRFDGWAPAVRAAGMRPHSSPRRSYTRRWSADACWEAMRRIVAELGAPPTVAQYELLAEGNDDLPSSATVRNRLGRWSSVVARLHSSESHPVLSRISVTSSTPADDRTEAIWLAYLAEEVTDDELARLAREGVFVWDESYGECPAAFGEHSAK